MGRVKLQIKKIENTTNRQVTFSKRRNGLIKKAYELSVLCDIDVALIMFSPSGRVSVFSGNKSIEEVVERYVNLPEHERGRRLQNQEYLHKVLGKLKNEADRTNRVVVSPPSADSQVEEVQQEILICKSHLEDMEKRLRNYEGDPWEIGTLAEADYREQVLDETLKQVRARKQALEEKYNSQNPETSNQVMPLQGAVQMNGFVEKNGSSFMIDWFPQRENDSIPALSFTSLLPLRDEGQQMDNILSSPSLNMLHASDMHLNNNDQNSTPSSNVENETQQPAPPPPPPPPPAHHHHQDQFGQVIDVNLSPWTDLYSPDPFPSAQPRERTLLELFLSQLAPVNQDQI